jgi:hypothetical protein
MKQKCTKANTNSVKNIKFSRKYITKCLKMSDIGKSSIKKNGIHQQQENEEMQQNQQLNIRHSSHSVIERNEKPLAASNNDNLVSCSINKSLEGGRLQFYKGK